MPRNRLPMVMKRYSPTGRRNHGRPLKRLLDTWNRNGSTSGPTPWQIYDDENPSSDSQVVPCGQAGGHYEANSRFSKFCKSAQKFFRSKKNWWKFSVFHNISNVIFCVKLTAEWILYFKKKVFGRQEVVMYILKLNRRTGNSFDVGKSVHRHKIQIN